MHLVLFLAGEAAVSPGVGTINNPAVTKLNTFDNKYKRLQKYSSPTNVKLKILTHPRIVKVLSSALMIIYTNLCFRVVGISQVLYPSIRHVRGSGADDPADPDPG